MRVLVTAAIICRFSGSLAAQTPDSQAVELTEPSWFADDSSWSGGRYCVGGIKHVLWVAFHSEASPKARQAVLTSVGGRILSPVGVDGDSYVWVANGSTLQALDSIAATLERMPAVEFAMPIAGCGVPVGRGRS